jgi:beta-glucosidase
VHGIRVIVIVISFVQADQNGELGMSMDVIWYEPISNFTTDVEATKRAQEFQLGW